MVWEKQFDGIFCLSLAGSPRRNRVRSEFDRVGILRSGIFEFWTATPVSALDDIIRKRITYSPRCGYFQDTDANRRAFACSMDHYRIMKSALASGRKRILIAEDDIVFLTDTVEIEKIVSALPLTGVTLLDKFTCDGRTFKKHLSRCVRFNERFNSFADGIVDLYSSACYSVDACAMKAITEQQETCFTASDDVWNVPAAQVSRIGRFYSITNVARQLSQGFQHINSGFDEDLAYSFVGLDPTAYANYADQPAP